MRGVTAAIATISCTGYGCKMVTVHAIRTPADDCRASPIAIRTVGLQADLKVSYLNVEARVRLWGLFRVQITF